MCASLLSARQLRKLALVSVIVGAALTLGAFLFGPPLVTSLLPGYAAMGSTGMGGMSHGSGPRNVVPMMTGKGKPP